MDINSFLATLETINTIVLKDAELELTGNEFVSAVKKRSFELEELGVTADMSAMIRLSNKVNSVISLFSLIHVGSTVFVATPYEPVEEASNKCIQFGINCLLGDKPALKGISVVLGRKNVNSVQHFESEFPLVFAQHNAKADRLPRGNKVAIFSSGTTGEPKAIVHHFGNLILNASLHAEAIGLQRTDVVGGVLPIHYSYGLVASLFASLYTGSCYCFQSRASGIDEQWAKNHKISVLSLTPFFANQLSIQLSSLRLLTLGGDALSKEIAHSIKDKFGMCELYSTYGLSEAGPRVSTWRFDNTCIPDSHIVPLGTPLKGVTLRVEKSNDEASIGELVVNTPTKMMGYYYGVGQKMQTFEADGSDVYTGDLFSNDNGVLTFQSRQKEMIVQNGEKLFPPVIESVIKRIDSVIDVNVVGVYAEDKGQIAKAKIYSSKEITVQEVRRALLKHLPHAVIPSQFEFVDGIDRSITGKKINPKAFNKLQSSTI